MKMDQLAGSQNDEFYTPRYAVAPILKYLPAASRIWCPFDTEHSRIVKVLRENGHLVSATHKDDGHDFFTTEPRGDLIVSNPPYSMKTEVFRRLFGLGKPFAMLVGIVGLFESEARFSLFAENDFEIMWLSKRVTFHRTHEEVKPDSQPPFSSAWVCRGLLPQSNTFERITRPKTY